MQPERRRDADAPPSHPATVIGRGGRSIASLLDEADRDDAQRAIDYDCTSGRHVSAEWSGVPLVSLLDSVGFPGWTTHVVVEGADGHAACVSIREAMDALLAVERDGKRLAHPRFVAPGVGGPRAVKDVRRIAVAALDPGADRSAYEQLSLESPDG